MNWPKYLRTDIHEPKCYLRSSDILHLEVPIINNTFQDNAASLFNPRLSRDVTVAMLVYRTITKKVFWAIIMQNLSDILPLFCTPTWPSHHVRENQEWPLR